MTRLQQLTVTALAALSVVSCSTPVATGYLKHQSQVEPGQFLDGVWCSDRLGSGPSYSAVKLISIEPRGIEDRRGVSAADAVSSLRGHLFAATGNSPKEDVLLSFSNAGPSADLELAITEMTPGSVAARFWAGEFGAGHAYVQVEGRLTDSTDGGVLCELVQRTRASGAVGFRDLGGDSGPAMVKQMLGMVARALLSELIAELGTPAA
jgi:hypothetical protein